MCTKRRFRRVGLVSVSILVTSGLCSCTSRKDEMLVQGAVVRYQLDVQLERYKTLSRLTCITLADTAATRPTREPSAAFVRSVQGYTPQPVVTWSLCD